MYGVQVIVAQHVCTCDEDWRLLLSLIGYQGTFAVQ